MPSEVFHHDEAVMGTVVSFDIYPSDLTRADEVLALALARKTLHRVDALFSTYREHSPMSLVRRGEIVLDEAPPEIAEVLQLCEVVRDLSDGWFDPWAMPGGVDPTGLVKGWSAERALDDLTNAGVGIASVNAGGDITTVGSPNGTLPWRFGISDPLHPGQLAAVAKVWRAIATSGTTERGEHLFDPHTGRASRAIASASVVGENLAVADGLATALGIAGPALFPRLVSAGYEGFVITSTGERASTSNFPFSDQAGMSGAQ